MIEEGKSLILFFFEERRQFIIVVWRIVFWGLGGGDGLRQGGGWEGWVGGCFKWVESCVYSVFLEIWGDFFLLKSFWCDSF